MIPSSITVYELLSYCNKQMTGDDMANHNQQPHPNSDGTDPQSNNINTMYQSSLTTLLPLYSFNSIYAMIIMMFKQEDVEKGINLNAMFSSKLPLNLNYLFSSERKQLNVSPIETRIHEIYDGLLNLVKKNNNLKSKKENNTTTTILNPISPDQESSSQSLSQEDQDLLISLFTITGLPCHNNIKKQWEYYSLPRPFLLPDLFTGVSIDESDNLVDVNENGNGSIANIDFISTKDQCETWNNVRSGNTREMRHPPNTSDSQPHLSSTASNPRSDSPHFNNNFNPHNINQNMIICQTMGCFSGPNNLHLPPPSTSSVSSSSLQQDSIFSLTTLQNMTSALFSRRKSSRFLIPTISSMVALNNNHSDDSFINDTTPTHLKQPKTMWYLIDKVENYLEYSNLIPTLPNFFGRIITHFDTNLTNMTTFSPSLLTRASSSPPPNPTYLTKTIISIFPFFSQIVHNTMGCYEQFGCRQCHGDPIGHFCSIFRPFASQYDHRHHHHHNNDNSNNNDKNSKNHLNEKIDLYDFVWFYQTILFFTHSIISYPYSTFTNQSSSWTSPNHDQVQYQLPLSLQVVICELLSDLMVGLFSLDDIISFLSDPLIKHVVIRQHHSEANSNNLNSYSTAYLDVFVKLDNMKPSNHRIENDPSHSFIFNLFKLSPKHNNINNDDDHVMVGDHLTNPLVTIVNDDITTLFIQIYPHHECLLQPIWINTSNTPPPSLDHELDLLQFYSSFTMSNHRIKTLIASHQHAIRTECLNKQQQDSTQWGCNVM